MRECPECGSDDIADLVCQLCDGSGENPDYDPDDEDMNDDVCPDCEGLGDTGMWQCATCDHLFE